VRTGGPLESPLLVGQYPPYVEAQLKAYVTGERKNDQYARMRVIARKLTAEEIADLPAYCNAPLATR
jgi:cytochrome c553